MWSGGCHPRTTAMTDAERKKQYRAWADRLRSKQRTLVAQSRSPEPVDVTPAKADGAFDFDLLETGPPPDDVDEPPDRLTGLLATFGLPADATMEDVAAAYRDLVRAHHPDQYEAAEGDVRAGNEQSLHDASATYRAIAALKADPPRQEDSELG